MTTLRESAQQALEALEERYVGALRERAMEALRAALEQPEQGPVAYLYHDAKSAHDANPLVHSTLLVLATERRPECRNETPLYTHPPRREWRRLTDKEIGDAFNATNDYNAFARAIEAALKERNA